jgi:hypothetical protein
MLNFISTFDDASYVVVKKRWRSETNGLRGHVARKVFTFISGLANKLVYPKMFPSFRVIMQR